MGVNNFFLKQVKKSIGFSKQRLLIIIISIFMGTCVTNAFLNVYFDIDNKMSKELKSYGANMVLSSKNSDFITIKQAQEIKSKIPKNKLLSFSPYLYFTPIHASRQILLAGVDFDEFRKINKFLLVTKGKLSPSEYAQDNAIYLGLDLAATLNKKVGDKLTLNYTSNDIPKETTFVVKGIFSSGDEIDGMAFCNIHAAQTLSQMDEIYSYVSLIVDDNANNLNLLAKTLSNDKIDLKTIPSVSLKEGAILEKIKGLMFLISLVILLISSTSVNTTLSSIILSRNKEIALHQALGASKQDIIKLFACEIFILAIFSALLGTLGGYALASFLGKVIFNASINFRLNAFILAIVISLIFAALAAIFPIKRALNVDITENLRGE